MEGNAYTRGLIERWRKDDQTTPWMGLCPDCKAHHARADDPSKTIPSRKRRDNHLTIQGVYDATRNILLTADELRENDLELSREDSIHLAVDLHFDPQLELNAEFREYLRWRQQQ